VASEWADKTGMTGWREAMTDYIRAEARPVDKYGHMPRLYALAAKLGEDHEHDDDILFAAAWMHDLGVFIGHRPADTAELGRWNHVPYTVARTRELLPGWGFPIDKIDAVAEAIETHQAADSPVKIEAILLHDADILEQLGAIGLMRAAAKTGRDSRFPTFSSVVAALRRGAGHLPGKLYLNSSREMAKPRVELLLRVIAALEEEGGRLLL
jgi:uncharacterized protein